MTVHEAVRLRRSVRVYQSKDVEEEKLKRILEAARLSPSARNEQPWKFIVVKNAQRRKELAVAANHQMFIAEAPVVIAAVALEPERVFSNEVHGYAVNLAIAIEHIVLAATAEGLGTCWICAFSQSKVRRILGVPDNLKVVALIP